MFSDDVEDGLDMYGWVKDEDLVDPSFESKIVRKLRRYIRAAHKEGRRDIEDLLKKALVLQKDREKDARVNAHNPEDDNDFLYRQIVTIGDKTQFDVPVFGIQGNFAFAYYEPDLQLDRDEEFRDMDLEFLQVIVTRTGYRTWKLISTQEV